MRYIFRTIVSTAVGISFFASPFLAFAATNPVEVGGTITASHNWSGYVTTSGTFTGVSGSWTVPSVTLSTSATADATWVGVGGISSNDLIQVGTQAITQNNAISYEAWYELLPETSVPIAMEISAGDLMSASIIQNSNGSWEIALRDNTTGQSFSTVVSYNSSLSSAEWIEEMPSDQVGYIPLDNFNTVSFTNAYAIDNGSTVSAEAAGASPLMMMTNAEQALATPSGLGIDGASFTVSRSQVAANVSPRLVRSDGRGGFRRGGSGITGYTPPTRTFFREHPSFFRDRINEIMRTVGR